MTIKWIESISQNFKLKCRGQQNGRWLRSEYKWLASSFNQQVAELWVGPRIFLSKNASDDHIQEEEGQGKANYSLDHFIPENNCRNFSLLKTQPGVCMVHWYPTSTPACSRKCHVPLQPQLQHTCCWRLILFHRDSQIGNRVLTLLLSQSYSDTACFFLSLSPQGWLEEWWGCSQVAPIQRRACHFLFRLISHLTVY